MKKLLRILCCFGLLIGCVMPAHAQQETSTQPLYREIIGFGGMAFGDEDDFTAGLALAFNASSRIGVEAEGGAIFAEDTTFNGSLNLVFNFGSGMSAIVPYFIGGAGFMNAEDSKITANAGGGLKIFIDYNIALRADFRAFFYNEGDDVENMQRLYGGLTFFF